MSPQWAKIVGLLMAGGFVIAARYFPEVSQALFGLAGLAMGKEFLSKTGDVSLTTHPDDMK